MSKYLEFVNELIDENPDLKKEAELISLKYEIIRLLIDYRKNKKMSQSDFAEKIGVKQQMISRFERGEVDPRLSFVSKVLIGMNYDIKFTEKDYLMTDDLTRFVKKKKTKIANNYNLIKDYEVAN